LPKKLVGECDKAVERYYIEFLADSDDQLLIQLFHFKRDDEKKSSVELLLLDFFSKECRILPQMFGNRDKHIFLIMNDDARILKELKILYTSLLPELVDIVK
jgi:hypothetical protein